MIQKLAGFGLGDEDLLEASVEPTEGVVDVVGACISRTRDPL
jgi:hypothetical protein